MKKTVLFVLALCLCFTAFSAVFAEGDTGEAAENDMILNDGTPWVDWSLRENIAQIGEKPDSPKDDFYLRTNYDWLKSTEIAPGQSYSSPFIDVETEVGRLCLEVLKDTTLKSEDAAQAQYLYNAFLDWDARNALGVEPLQKTINRISAVSTLDELTRMLCDKEYAGEKLFEADVQVNYSEPDTWITDIQPIDLLLDDSAEYRERTEQGDYFEAVYREFMPRMLEKLGYSTEEADGMLTRTFALEAELADSIMTSAEEYEPDFYQRISNQMSRAEAETLCSALPWLEMLDGQGYAGAQRYQVEQPAYLQKLDGIYREERLEDLKNYLIVSTVYDHMKILDRESFDLYNDIRNSKYGIEGSLPDEERACQEVRSNLPKQTDCAFFEKYDPTKMKADITRICEEVIDCYRKMLREEDWLAEETRAKAIEKLDKMRITAVCPEKWPDYSGLSLEGLGYYDCIREIKRYKARFSESLVDQPRDPDLWYYTMGEDWVNDILTTNAMYSPELNEIIILRGILGDAIYREDMSDEEMCGAIGMIIAHEISHAFDPTCASFDADGRMNNWWTEADEASFAVRAQKLIDYYNSITAFSGLQVSGENVQGEAVADMGSVKCMLRLLEGKKEDVDYRAFFEAFATAWREVITLEAESYLLTLDNHPLNYIRVNTVVQQFPQFHETYGITEGDGMWLAPENRVLVW